MKHKITAGLTSFLDSWFFRDMSQTSTVAGLTGVTNASSGLKWSYRRKGDTASTPVTLVAGTLGTYTSFNPSAPGAPTNAGSGSGGTIPAGTYFTAVTWTANGGETAIGTASSSVTLSGSTSSIVVTQPGSPPAGVTGWKVYLSTSSGGPWYLAGGSPDINHGGVGTAIATTTITATSYSTSNAQPPGSTTISGGGWVAEDATNMQGCYELSYPNPMIASGFMGVTVVVQGVINMGETPGQIELDAVNYQGNVAVDLQTIKTQAVTCAAGVTIEPFVGNTTHAIVVDSSGNVTFNNTAIGTVTNLTNLPSIPINWLTAAGIASGALNGKGDWLLASSYVVISKNQALNNFEFPMVSSSDHVSPKTGLGTGVTCQRSLDGGTFASCANGATEVGSGIYAINLAAADLNARVVTLAFSGTGADTTFITLVTQ